MPQELKAGTQLEVCAPGFTAALFTAKRQKQTECLSTDEQINSGMVYTYYAIICNSQKLERTQISTNRWMYKFMLKQKSGKEVFVHLCSEQYCPQ